MRLRLKNKSFSLSLTFFRKREVVGVNSKVPFAVKKGESREHYHLFDIDDALSPEFVDFWKREAMGDYPHYSYRSPRGVHIISFRRGAFPEVVERILRNPTTDQKWVGIGVKRGYFFLESYSLPPIWTRKQLSFMRIQRAKR